ncbi:AAA family ATPase [Butyrivibrio sp. AE3004]|uniref:AAA family ATPase n=1 Tax=Butyrivibrio sp. AE3004 TaxID=1506994 RepID=UPI0004949513|nr:AAA family ATPase [Butyrivibrio sp. AE3004]
MRLEISNIGPLKNANIELEGITIIAGQNNVGKSTVGKTLFALLQNMEVWSMIYEDQCARLIYEIFDKENVILEDLCLSIEGVYRRRTNRISMILNALAFSEDIRIAIEDYKSKDCNSKHTLEELVDKFCDDYISVYMPADDERKIFKKQHSEKLNKWKTEILNHIDDMEFDELELQKGMIFNCINEVFEKQAIKIGSQNAEIKYTDSIERDIRFQFDHDNCEQNIVIRENNRIFYIETSKLFDFLSDAKHGSDQKAFLQFLMRPNIYKMKNLERQYDLDYNKSKGLLNLDKSFSGILARLENVMGGNASFYQKIGLEFKDERYTETIHAGNVSAGLKSMALLEYALRIGAIKAGDIMILDEPEINLHPEWQVEYARTIVELEKQCNIKFIITSHSPFFIRALECYADIYGKMGEMNVYELTKREDGEIEVENVSYSEFGMSKLYDDLAAPLDALDALLEGND